MELSNEEMWIKLQEIRRTPGLRMLNLGCGSLKLEGATNVDKYDTSVCDIQADAAGPLPFGDGSYDYIETQQMIEHLTVGEYERALQEWTRILAPGGFLVIGTFDMEKIFTGYPFELTKMNVWMWRTISWMIYGSQEHEGHFHKSAMAPDYLQAVLEKLGYRVQYMARNYPVRPTPTFTMIARRSGNGI